MASPPDGCGATGRLRQLHRAAGTPAGVAGKALPDQPANQHLTQLSPWPRRSTPNGAGPALGFGNRVAAQTRRRTAAARRSAPSPAVGSAQFRRGALGPCIRCGRSPGAPAWPKLANGQIGAAHTQAVSSTTAGDSPGASASDRDDAVLRAWVGISFGSPRAWSRPSRPGWCWPGLDRLGRARTWLAAVADRPGPIRALRRHQQRPGRAGHRGHRGAQLPAD